MKAVVLRETGGPEQLHVEDVDEPDPPALRVHAAGVNFLDVLVRRGEYPQMPPLPHVLGSEVAGELDGRRVMALPPGGGYAELATADADWVFPLPEGASFEEGAAFLMAFLSAWIPLRGLAGGTVLVTAASGGVGGAAVQVAKHLGAHVVAAASTEEKRHFALELGADEAVGYDALPPCDVVFDPVGGDVFTACLAALRPLGTLVAVGFAGGLWQDVSPALLVGRNVAVRGFYLGRLMRHDPALVRAAAEEVLALWQQGAIRPVVGATFPLEQAAEAHRSIDERRHLGKVVLVP
ncbi:MAG: NADPH:quinone oxidoreductase family protein [Gaiellaceae bacterium]